MKKIVKSILLILLIVVFLQKFYEPMVSRVSMLSPYIENARQRLGFEPSVCEEPMPYVIGNFDTKFGISKADFISAIGEAEKMWEEPFGRQFFYYDEGNQESTTLKVHLVYDFRQEATKKINALEETVKVNRASYDSLRIKLDEEKSDLQMLKTDYEQYVAKFNASKEAYEKEVDYWNSKGGAPENEYKKLQASKAALDIMAAELNAKAKKINATVNEINALVVVLNSLAAKLNLSVDDYNTIGASRGESFEEGVYTSDGISQEIEIYEFSNRAKLIRVLAHELGHALGLDHISDPQGIMYKLNEGSTSFLSTEDKEALRVKCGFK